TEAGVAGAVLVGVGGEDQQAGVDVGDRDGLGEGHDPGHQLQRAVGRQAGDDDIGQGVGRGVVGIAEPEVGGGHGPAAVFQHGDGLVGAGRSVVYRGDVEGYCVCDWVGVDAGVSFPARRSSDLTEAGVAGAVLVGVGGEDQQAGVDVGD